MTHRTRHTQTTALLGSLSGSSLDRLHTLADTLVDSLWGEVYAPQGPVPKDDLWRSCHDNIGNALKALNGVGPPAAVLLETARATGMRRARQHCPLGWVQRAWRIGGQVIWEDFACQAGVDDADELRRLVESASRVWQVNEQFSAEMAAAYQSVEQEIAGDDQRADRVVAGREPTAAVDGGRRDPPSDGAGAAEDRAGVHRHAARCRNRA